MKKKFEGIVKAVSMQKTAVVEVVTKKPHPMYRKLLTYGKTYKVDTDKFSVQTGDKVIISETRPLSKDKHFVILEVLPAGRQGLK